jgi:deazaflavin-dependent oxidoreductase (nitroreductase family)
VAREDVARTQAPEPLVRELGEEPVAGGVPGAIVDLLEVVEVDRGDRERGAGPVGDRALARGGRREPGSVQRAGELVGADLRLVVSFDQGSVAMSTSPADFNASIIEEFRANEGRVGGPFEGNPLLLLHHTGARSGESYVNPLAYQADQGRYVIFASKGGAPENPGWYHNLMANPDTTIEVGTETLPVRAQEAAGDERRRLFEAQVQRIPVFGEYEEKAGRTIPVIVLTPVRER